MIKSLQKYTWKCFKKEVVYSSDQKAAKMFVKDPVLVKMQGYSCFIKVQYSIEKLFL